MIERATTLNWDTAYAVPIDIVNKAIKDNKSSPKNFQFEDLSGNICEGNFGDWQVTTGGSGSQIFMKLPINEFNAKIIGSKRKFLNGNGGFKSADMNIMVKFSFFPHDEISKSKESDLVDLKVRSKSTDPIDPVVVVMSLENISEYYFNYLEPSEDDFRDIIEEIFKGLIKGWLEKNLQLFNHIFSIVNLNLYISEYSKWSWSRPSYVSYAYTDVGKGMDKGILGVLCMTGGRKPEYRQQIIDSNAIPKNSQSGFLIYEERVLRDILLPTLPMKFKNSNIQDYEVINATGENGQYQYVLRLKKNKIIRLERVEANGSKYDPYMMEMSISLVNDTLKLEAVTHTNIGSGGIVGCTTINRYRLTLKENEKGEETISYEEVGESTINNFVVKEGTKWVWKIVAGIMETLGFVVLGIFTSGASFFIAGLALSLLSGVVARTPDMILGLNLKTSPSINLMLENSTSQIVWNARDVFNLNQVALNGPLQLGGELTV
ncbi:TULIP family P47-like protein [Clostridium sp. Marseille-Q2269]|uniref:TULIP family P47-like protein n=1 Tax=Clostridium sp. Marseille-Q2269 TaxID=2942205 RepID=UPI0020736B7C|nr:TULIP family P47-like protein [Clostridium sp. Marseille-Q2269]